MDSGNAWKRALPMTHQLDGLAKKLLACIWRLALIDHPSRFEPWPGHHWLDSSLHQTWWAGMIQSGSDPLHQLCSSTETQLKCNKKRTDFAFCFTVLYFLFSASMQIPVLVSAAVGCFTLNFFYLTDKWFSYELSLLWHCPTCVHTSPYSNDMTKLQVWTLAKTSSK